MIASFWTIEREAHHDRVIWQVSTGRPDGTCWHATGTLWHCIRTVAHWLWEWRTDR